MRPEIIGMLYVLPFLFIASSVAINNKGDKILTGNLIVNAISTFLIFFIALSPTDVAFAIAVFLAMFYVNVHQFVRMLLLSVSLKSIKRTRRLF